MNDDRWPEAKDILARAIELEPEERQAFVESRCGSDPELRRDVEAYLALDDVSDFIENPLLDLFAGQPPEARAGDRLGPFQLERQLGRGGFGVVYLASRIDGDFDQSVAVKILRRGLDSGDIVRRFFRERQILADLEHPNIAQILDGGVTDDGLPFFAMEHVDGVALDAYCKAHGLGLDARLALFQTVCEAVHAAHRSLVVHCDLKPSNILVKADGTVKLLDFGIAKILREDGTHPTQTLGGLALGSPPFASPEQAAGEAITTASDVYSLGSLLFLLLTGQPYDDGGGLGPKASSTLLRSQQKAFHQDGAASPPIVWRRLRGDLDTILRRALHPDPERRYSSAAGLRDDIERHRTRRPVTARPDSARYLVGRFLARHPVEASIAAIGLVGILIALFFLSLQLRRTEHQRDRAAGMRDAYLELLEALDPSASEHSADAARGALEKALASAIGTAPADRAILFDRMGRIYYRFSYFDEARRLLERAVALRLSDPAADRSLVAASKNNLALVWLELGEDDRAISLFREALVEQGHGRPADDASWLDGMNNLATAHQKQGRLREAEALFRLTLAQKRTLHGPGSHEVATGTNNLANLLIRQHRLDEAEPLMRESLAARRALLGPEHPKVALALINLGVLLDGRGASEEAIGAMREALAIRQKHFGAGTPEVARAGAALGFVLLGVGDERALVEAEGLLLQGYEDLGQRRGLDDRQTLTVGRNLAATLVARGRPGEALALIRQVVERADAAWPDGHWRRADSRSVLGECLANLGRFEEGLGLLEAGSEAIRAGTGKGSRYDRDHRRRLACAYRAAGHRAGAAALGASAEGCLAPIAQQ